MYLIDDIDFECTDIWLESGFFYQIPDILDSIVRRSIDLDTIEHIPLVKCDTMSTHMAWIPILQVQTIHSFGQYASGCSLAGSTRAGEDIRMTDSVLDQ